MKGQILFYSLYNMVIILKGNDLIHQHSKVGKEHIPGTSSSKVNFLSECVDFIIEQNNGKSSVD